MSILCGINDVGFQLRENKGIATEKYRFIYDRMLYEVQEKNPDAKLVIMEPFVFKINLENTNINNRNDIYLHYDFWRKEVAEKAEVSKELAAKYNAVYVPLVKMFDEYIAKNCVEDLTADGIHPTLKGHKLIAAAWLDACKEIVG